jgi:hypothetical protein
VITQWRGSCASIAADIVLEPMPRDSGPTVAVAAALAAAVSREAPVLVRLQPANGADDSAPAENLSENPKPLFLRQFCVLISENYNLCHVVIHHVEGPQCHHC